MNKWYDDKLEEFKQANSLTPKQSESLDTLLNEIVEGEREDAIGEMEYPPIDEFVGDNFSGDILDAIEYSDIVEYVANIESTKQSDDYDYRSER